MPNIGAVLVLIGLILLAVAVALAAVVLLRPRQGGESRKGQDLNGSEREVYEGLYGRRSTTVSAPVPVERPPESDGPPAGLSE